VLFFDTSAILFLSFDLICSLSSRKSFPSQLVSELSFEMADEGKIRVERFNKVNFGFWKMQIKDYLYQNFPLDGKTYKPKEMCDGE